MSRRSFRASTSGIAKAKKAFDSKGWTQEYLATESGLSSRQSVWKFFTGRPIERYIFKEICFRLDIDWEEIVDLPKMAAEPEIVQTAIALDPQSSLEDWVKFLHSQLHDLIQTTCNTLQSSFDVTQPELSDIYTALYILPQPARQRWLEVSDLKEAQATTERLNLSPDNPQVIAGIDVIAEYSKLMLLGKPGAGKTTFLQYLALQCNQGNYREDLVPIFIQLRSLITENSEEEEFNFSHYFSQIFQPYCIPQDKILLLLQEGRFLLLLDGLDEISLQESEKLLKQIDKFAQDYYKNQIIITCRSAAQTYHFRGFNYVEIADFSYPQIEIFAQKWFMAVNSDPHQGVKKAEQFLEQLNRPENRPIRELGITPILLNLICSVFRERESFPTKRSKLYQAGLDILLQRWDQARGIQRDQIYRYLSLTDKIKLLCQIAATTFEQENYFFETPDVLSLIEDYLRNLSQNASPTTTDLETLWLNSEAVLKAIELQHGLLVERARDIYSFSHLTFQEYLTARKIVATPAKQLTVELERLGARIYDKNWREVIALTVSMLPKANFLLQRMKMILDESVQQDPDLINCLEQIETKVRGLKLAYKPAAIRAYYFTLFLYRDLNLAIALDVKFGSQQTLSKELALDSALARIYGDATKLQENPDAKKYLHFCFGLDLEQKFSLAPDFAQTFKTLKANLPNLETSLTACTETPLSIADWWTEKGPDWLTRFWQMLIQYRGIGQYWRVSSDKIHLWYQYYQGNLFLVECLHSDCAVNPEVRQSLEANLMTVPH